MSKVYGELNPPVRLLLGPGPSNRRGEGFSVPKDSVMIVTPSRVMSRGLWTLNCRRRRSWCNSDRRALREQTAGAVAPRIGQSRGGSK